MERKPAAGVGLMVSDDRIYILWNISVKRKYDKSRSTLPPRIGSFFFRSRQRAALFPRFVLLEILLGVSCKGYVYEPLVLLRDSCHSTEKGMSWTT